jgi:hypothetical protein
LRRQRAKSLKLPGISVYSVLYWTRDVLVEATL